MSLKLSKEEDSRYILIAEINGKFFAGIGNKNPESKFQQFTKKHKPNWTLAVVPRKTRDEIKKQGIVIIK